MKKITTLNSNAKQRINIFIPDLNKYVTFHFEFIPNQLGWFFGFDYNDIKYRNIRLTTSYNVLRSYRNWLPFGLRCDTIDGLEPMGIQDFVSKYCTIYILTKKETNTTESLYYAKETEMV